MTTIIRLLIILIAAAFICSKLIILICNTILEFKSIGTMKDNSDHEDDEDDEDDEDNEDFKNDEFFWHKSGITKSDIFLFIASIIILIYAFNVWRLEWIH